MNPVEDLESCLVRIAANPAVNAFLHVDIAGARAAAQASLARHRAGAVLSGIDGMVIGVKANIAVRGMPFHGGIGAYRERVADADAECVAALRRAGAVILGILNMHEAGLGGTSDNPFFGACRNPNWPGLSPGGSSGGGAAAVAAGLCEAALGTDTLGSVRIPAGYCGVFGHKPSAGLIPTGGLMPLSPTLDSVGIQAGSAEACVAVLAVFAPVVSSAPATLAVLDLSGQAALDPEVAQALHEAAGRAAALGLRVQTLRLANVNLAALRRAGLLVAEVEAEAFHHARLAECPEGFSPEFRKLMAWAAVQPAAKFASAMRQITEAAALVRAALAGIDVLLLPNTPQPPFAFGAAPPTDQADLTALANIAGLAATAFPAGAPVSLQVVSASDAWALNVAGRLSI
jgi:aspartyl-tRNA(Asn)/glutamyl-tRNA(Gln) amidotransferase subunit A